ncbi:lycopene cyclase domain-containing protein [Mucilaginibacter robiniae]|uniref:Lycopene cyclase domain-containing protein n=1 Tax=Mucilaginibacter robiniae TaxID=2728022 RepID=A0A7L5E593_9SPHI|nr:lycopene cyclase domain-containing protein [Mucilaginibacter robiniae]QJD95506.1 lycopene cyclase domain-containing protein [Mucilaginibacter robiniae]
MRYAYLLINFLTVIFPVLLSFDKRVRFYKKWKYIWPGMAITGLVFLFWDVLFTIKGVWSFNPDFITGLTFFRLPIEEILFFLTVPFSCIFIYACLNYYVRKRLPSIVSQIISAIIIILSLVMLALYHNRLYTLVTFSLLLVLIAVLQYVFKSPWLKRFYVAYIVSLLPFYIVNGVLTAIPIVIYNNAENIGKRVGTIPFEDHFYSMALLLMNVGFYEYFKRRAKTIAAA